MTTTEMKTKIRAHLANVNEATAKQIAKAIDHEKYPTEVIKALSEMRTDAEVECEKKAGKGNEYWYWLTKAGDSVKYTVGLPSGKEINISSGSPKAPAKAPESSPVEQTVSQGLEMYNLRQQLKHAETMRDAHFESAEAAARRIDELVVQLREADSRHEALKAQLDELLVKMADADQAKDITEAAAGYIVRIPGKKPRICVKPENARNAALSGARQHGRADVLALVPVGKAVRGAEWKEAA